MISNLLKIIYPYHCINCKKELLKSYFCHACHKKISLINEQVCPVCEKKSPQGITHSECKKRTPLSGVFVVMNYNEECTRKIIKEYKYKFVKKISKTLISILLKAIKNNNYRINTHNTVITNVPLHKKRLHWRGFNQSTTIAKNLAKLFNLPYAELLSKTKKTKPQKNIQSYQERQNNIQGVFTLKNNVSDSKYLSDSDTEYKKSTIIIVDDITTTLSTLNECARALQPLSPKSIYAIVLARNQRNQN